MGVNENFFVVEILVTSGQGLCDAIASSRGVKEDFLNLVFIGL